LGCEAQNLKPLKSTIKINILTLPADSIYMITTFQVSKLEIFILVALPLVCGLVSNGFNGEIGGEDRL
jgi:hypothetical protein